MAKKKKIEEEGVEKRKQINKKVVLKIESYEKPNGIIGFKKKIIPE